MNKIYLVDFDNGCEQEDNESWVCAIFDSYEKAEEYILSKGYNETGTKGLFSKPWKYTTWSKYYLSITECEINRELDGLEPE
jgi:hypothetical protein